MKRTFLGHDGTWLRSPHVSVATELANVVALTRRMRIAQQYARTYPNHGGIQTLCRQLEHNLDVLLSTHERCENCAMIDEALTRAMEEMARMVTEGGASS